MSKRTHLFRPGTVGPYCGHPQPEYGGFLELIGTDDKGKFARIAANSDATFPACKRCVAADKRSPAEREAQQNVKPPPRSQENRHDDDAGTGASSGRS